jgi:hypothetical protein
VIDRVRQVVGRWPRLAAGLAATALTLAVWQPSGVVAQQPPDEGALLRELAERLLGQPAPAPPGVMLPPVRLLPGELPPDLPITPPLPPGARLIGSVLRPVLYGTPTSPGPEVAEGVEIVLDVPQSPAAVLEFYQQAFTAQGLTAPSAGRGFRPGGFLPSIGVTSSAFICRSDRGPFVELVALPREGQPTDVRLRVQPFPGPCGATFGPPGPPPLPPSDPVPPLEPPAGVTVLPGGGGGSPFLRSYDAVAVTSMSVGELEAHYARQLATAGWTRTAGGADGPLAWSVWRVPAEEPRPGEMPAAGERQGLLFVLEGPGADRRSLHVQVAAAGQNLGGPPGAIVIAPAPGR